MELGVLAHQSNGHGSLGMEDALHHSLPLCQVRLRRVQTQPAAHHLVQAFLGQQQGHLIESGGGGVLDDALRGHIAEQRQLPADVLGDGAVAAAHQHVGLDAHPQQLLHRVLGGLALELPGAGDGDDEGDVEEGHVLPAPLGGHLTDGLQEGLGLDVAHGAADLAQHHVHIAGVHGVDPALDLVGDMGDDLDGGAQIVAPALPVEHGPVHLARGHGAVAREALIHEPLIVAQVQVRLGAVVGDEHLAVLVGAHGPRVYVDIGVKFLVADPQAPLLQKTAQGRGADALAQA